MQGRRLISPRHTPDLTIARIWRLALHRMDTRTYVPQDPPPEARDNDSGDPNGRIYFGPGEPEEDIREMVDESQRSTAIFSRHIGLLNLARQAWQRDSSFDAASWRTSLLEEARVLERELDEPEEFMRDGPGFAVAVCIRDHLTELNEDEIRWCAERIEREVRRSSRITGEIDRLQRIRSADRVCASVVPLLSTVEGRQDTVDVSRLLSLALTHPVNEVSDCAFEGLGAFLGDGQKELILRCIAAEALRARLMSRVTREEDEFEVIVPRVRRAIEAGLLDTESEIASLDFNQRPNHIAIKRALGVLRHHPSWDESRHFYGRAAVWIADAWDSERRHDTGYYERSMDLEQLAVQQVAGFVLGLRNVDALRICSPLLERIGGDPHNAERFANALFMTAYGNSSDCFWGLWKSIAERVAQSPWAERLSDDGRGPRLLSTVFLSLFWDRSVQPWQRLVGNAHLIDELAHRLPPTIPCVLAYSSFLSTIGRESLPNSFKVIGELLEKGEGDRIASHSSIAFNLETLLRDFVYSQPHRLKKDPGLRKAVLVILDALITGGSSSAYRMRDDFVTPFASGD